jgi:hypothetical protein
MYMNKYHTYVIFIFFIKICFMLMVVTHIYLKAKGEEQSDLDKKILYLKERFEFIFIASMSILIIYLFNPIIEKSILIDKETKVLLFLFGFILLITANWDIFFRESPLFIKIQKSIGLT